MLPMGYVTSTFSKYNNKCIFFYRSNRTIIIIGVFILIPLLFGGTIKCDELVADPCSKDMMKWSYYRPQFHEYMSDLSPFQPHQAKYFYFNECILSNVNATANTVYTFKPNSVTGTFIAANCNLLTIPKGLFDSLHELRNVSMAGAGITQLLRSDLTGANQLASLNLSSNTIAQLDANVFQHSPALTSIDLSFNQIATIDRSTFDGLTSLVVLLLNHNRLTTFNAALGKQIKILRLNNNRIDRFEPELSLVADTILTELSLGNNLLTALNESIHIDYSQTDKIDLSNNPLVIMVDSKFESTQFLNISNTSTTICYISTTVKILDASNNQIGSIVVTDALRSPIEEFSLSHNNVSSVKNLTELKYLRNLDLSFNPINDFEIDSFANMISLEQLILENCGLKTIDYGTFSHLRSLTHLDISYNRLGSFDLGMLSFQRKLQQLYVDGNDLRTLDVSEFVLLFPYLEYVGINDNQFNCSYLTDMVRAIAKNHIKLVVATRTTNGTNVLGMACLRNSNDLNVWSMPPVHAHNHTEAFAAVEQKINSIMENVKAISQSDDSLGKKEYDRDMTLLRQQMMKLQNDVDLKLIDQKSDIVLTISKLFADGISNSSSDDYANLKYELDNNRRVTLERFQTLTDRLNSLAELLTETIKNNNNDEIGTVAKMDALYRTGGTTKDLTSSISNNNYWQVAFVCSAVLIVLFGICCGVAYVVYKRRQQVTNSRRDRMLNAESINTINTMI